MLVWVIGMGYLGCRLYRALERDGCRLVSIDLHDQGDASDELLLRRLRHCYGEPQFIYCAQATHGGDCAQYRHAYVKVLQALDRVLPQAELIFCSSCSVYGGEQGECMDESSVCLARSERAAILLEAEQIVLARRGRVARLAALYGPGRSVLKARYLAGVDPIAGDASRILNYVHVDDAVAALCLLREVATGVYNVVGECLSKAEILLYLQQLYPHQLITQQAPPSRRGQSNHRVLSRALTHLSWLPQHHLSAFLREDEDA